MPDPIPLDIRPIPAEDAAAYRALRDEALTRHPLSFWSTPAEEPPDVPATAAQLASIGRSTRATMLGAYVDGALVGTAAWTREPDADTGHKAVMWGAYVRHGHRRRGIARRLIEAALAGAAAQGVQRATGQVAAGNTDALRLYLDLGWSVWGREPDSMRVDGRPVDGIRVTVPVARGDAAGRRGGFDPEAQLAIMAEAPDNWRPHEKIWHWLLAQRVPSAALDALDARYAAVKAGGARAMDRYREGVDRALFEAGRADNIRIALALGRRNAPVHAVLYQQMATTHDLLARHGIEAWLASGTLIGALRHGGIIPWDRDIDLEIAEADEPRLRALAPAFVEAGLMLKHHLPHHYKVAYNFDIFVHHARPETEKGAVLFPLPDELWPLGRHRFGDRIWPVPRAAEASLSRSYGPDWRLRGRVWNFFFNDFFQPGHDADAFAVDIEAYRRAAAQGSGSTAPGASEM